MGRVRAYQYGDAEFLAPRLRAADRDEIRASSGRTPEERLPEAQRLWGILCTILDHTDTPAGMFGVVPTSDLAGAVWMCGSDALTASPLRRQLLTEGHGWLNRLHTFRPLLFNVVDERNTVHIRWIRWMGFTFIRRIPHYGVEQRPFLEFVRIKHV